MCMRGQYEQMAFLYEFYRDLQDKQDRGFGVDTHHPHPNPLPSREREFLCVCGGSTSRWRSCRTSFTGIYRINRMGVLGVDTHHPHPNPLPSREMAFL